MNAEEPEFWLYNANERFFDKIARRHDVNVDPFACLAVQSKQQQYMSYIRRAPAFTVSDKDNATPATQQLQEGMNRFKVYFCINDLYKLNANCLR